MLAKRIIPCLDVKDNRVVKGIHFLNLRDAGDPVELGARYSDDGADELVFLDITARDLQRKDHTWFRGKGFDTFGPIGPWIVLKDEVENPNNLKLELRVNDGVRQVGNTRDMIFSVSEIIHHVSNVVSLVPGDVIATGTPSGVGKLEKGDKVFSRIENIGILENTVQ